MKQFIVLAAVLPILMVFTMQTVYDQRSSHAEGIIHDMVYAAKEQAKEEGSFTPEIQERLKRNVSARLDIPPGEISITSREESGLIFYRVEVPIKDVVAGNKLFGIKDEDNQYIYVIDSYTRCRATLDSVDEEEENDAGNSAI